MRRRTKNDRPAGRTLPTGGIAECDVEAIHASVSAPVVVVATDPWQAENLFHTTGHRVPSVRPLALYSANCARPQLRPTEIFVTHDRGRCLACDIFVRSLLHAVPPGYPLRFVHSPEYRPFCSLGGFRAAVVVPHGNVVMQQFRELHTLHVPLYVPASDFLLTYAAVAFHPTCFTYT